MEFPYVLKVDCFLCHFFLLFFPLPCNLLFDEWVISDFEVIELSTVAGSTFYFYYASAPFLQLLISGDGQLSIITLWLSAAGLAIRFDSLLTFLIRLKTEVLVCGRDGGRVPRNDTNCQTRRASTDGHFPSSRHFLRLFASLSVISSSLWALVFTVVI